eukprot:g53190.t1
MPLRKRRGGNTSQRKNKKEKRSKIISEDEIKIPVDKDSVELSITASERTVVTGWHSEQSAPNQVFEENIESKNGRLFFHGIDLAQIADGKVVSGPTFPEVFDTVELIYLPAIRARVKNMIDIFKQASAKLGYEGRFLYSYASKANAAFEVMRAVKETGAHQETSACYDIAAILREPEHLLFPGRLVICNGFKLPLSQYSILLCQLIQRHPGTIPIIEDTSEVAVYAKLETPHKIQLGIRLKCWGKFDSPEAMASCDSRFGFTVAQADAVAQKIQAHPNLELKMIHAMVGSPVNRSDLVKLRAPLHAYALLKKKYPSIDTFNFGGGMPARQTPGPPLDYPAYVETMLERIKAECKANDVHVPHLTGEFGRYTVTDHCAHIFKVISVRENCSPTPYYIINGSVMSSFPDTWALKEHFTVLPLNYLDRPFRSVKIGGATCDSDDMYPPHYTNTQLFLPAVTNEDSLFIGFFNVGAYQEMLGGVAGAKHCGIPESDELCIDVLPSGKHKFEFFPGQKMDDVLRKLGYRGVNSRNC